MKSFFPTSDFFNPILVRELRQMVRNRLIVFSINLYLAVMIAFFGFMMIEFIESPSETFGLGLFYGLNAITTISTFFAVVLYSGWKVAVDRINEDLLFFTSLTPSQNIRGRLVCGFVISLLFFSMSTPFIVTTYFFRGVDLWMYAVYLPLPFFLVQGVNLIAVAILSATRSYFQLVFYALLFLVAAVAVYAAGFYLFLSFHETVHAILNGHYSFYYHHGGSITSSPLMPILQWTPLIYYVLSAIVLLIFVVVTSYLFGRCNLSPYSENRMYPIRRWLSMVIVGTLLVWFIYSWLERYDWILCPDYYGRNRYGVLTQWFFWVVGIFSIMLVMAVCERETWEGRLRRAIPKAIWHRVLVFPLYTGSVNGLLWAFIGTFLLTMFIGVFISTNIMDNNALGGINMIFQALIFLMLIFDYSMTAFFLWKILLHHWIPREMIWMITVGLLAAVSFGTFFATFLLHDGMTGNFENNILLSPNPFLVFMGDAVGDFQIFCGFLWFILIMPCAYPWLRGRFLDFTPEEPEQGEGNK